MKYFLTKNGLLVPFDISHRELLYSLASDKSNSAFYEYDRKALDKLVNASNTFFLADSVSANELAMVNVLADPYDNSTLIADCYEEAEAMIPDGICMLVSSYYRLGTAMCLQYYRVEQATFDSLYRKSVIDEMLETL